MITDVHTWINRLIHRHIFIVIRPFLSLILHDSERLYGFKINSTLLHLSGLCFCSIRLSSWWIPSNCFYLILITETGFTVQYRSCSNQIQGFYFGFKRKETPSLEQRTFLRSWSFHWSENVEHFCKATNKLSIFP